MIDLNFRMSCTGNVLDVANDRHGRYTEKTIYIALAALGAIVPLLFLNAGGALAYDGDGYGYNNEYGPPAPYAYNPGGGPPGPAGGPGTGLLGGILNPIISAASAAYNYGAGGGGSYGGGGDAGRGIGCGEDQPVCHPWWDHPWHGAAYYGGCGCPVRQYPVAVPVPVPVPVPTQYPYPPTSSNDQASNQRVDTGVYGNGNTVNVYANQDTGQSNNNG